MAGLVPFLRAAHSLQLYRSGKEVCFGLNMQKSGLVDTMWDLIVDTIGSGVVALMGFAFLKSGRESFIIPWLRHFAEGNPGLIQAKKE